MGVLVIRFAKRSQSNQATLRRISEVKRRKKKINFRSILNEEEEEEEEEEVDSIEIIERAEINVVRHGPCLCLSWLSLARIT